MTMSDIHSLSGAYALDAVDDIERAAFERHLRECSSCSLEVLELRETVGRLSDSVAVEPPPRLRASVLQAVARTPQTPPGRAPRGGPAASAQRWRRFAAASVAAGVIAVGIGIGTWTIANRNLDDARRATAAAEAQLERVGQILAAPDAKQYITPATGGGTVTVTVSRSMNAAVAAMGGMPDAGAGKIYQLWMIPAGEPAVVAQSVGTTPPGDTSTTQVVPVGDAKAFAVTVEPGDGGSDKPTTEPVAFIALT
jgi:anti-sigma-K factor RskA